MKITEYKTVRTEKEVSVKEFCKSVLPITIDDEDMYNYFEAEDYIYNLLDEFDYTDEEYNEVSETLLPFIREAYAAKEKQIREDEIKMLSNKETLLDIIKTDVMSQDPCPGDIGFMLSPEEILNIICKTWMSSE